MFQELCGKSHITNVDVHGAMKRLLYLAAFLVVERPQALTFLDSSSDIEQGPKQVTGHDLAWKLQQIPNGSVYILHHHPQLGPALAPNCSSQQVLRCQLQARVLPGTSWVGSSRLSALQKEVGKDLRIGERLSLLKSSSTACGLRDQPHAEVQVGEGFLEEVATAVLYSGLRRSLGKTACSPSLTGPEWLGRELPGSLAHHVH